MASSSTSSIEKNFKYPVFLSFRGADTRKNIVGHLYDALNRQGIYTFKDDVELEKGKNIDELFKAIEESKFFIVVFSKNYASSSWCLRELAKLMEYQKTKEQIVFPIFYDVDPAHIREQIGDFGRAFAKHKNDQVGKWKKALEDAGNLVGWDLRNSVEAEAVNEIVEKISVNLRSFQVGNDENLTGLDPQIKKVLSFLETSTGDVRMIGIKGMGGVGKTTLAGAVFDQVSFLFDGVSFIENVREVPKAGLLSLQQRVLADVNSKNGHMSVIRSVHEGIKIIKERLRHIKVLIVLDDVEDNDYLEALAGATDWFKEGSRIIITTRDEQVLKAHGVNANWIHDVDFLKDDEALSLFSRYAFKGYIPAQGYGELSSEVVRYAAGLPLTLKVLGASLFGKEKHVWRDAVNRLEKIPCKQTLEKLEISYIGLDDNLKEIFLDVACFMKGLRIEDAITILESCKLYPIYGLKVLEEKSLVTISNQCLGMHNSIEEMGKIIVRRNLTGEPNKHSRLWIREEIEKLLSDDVGTEATTHIRLDQVELSPEKVMEGLGKLKKLRVLLLTGRDDACSHNDWKFDQAKQYFSNTLQFLRWEGYPVWSLPQTFRADNLVGLELPRSRITELRESGNKKVLNFNKLRFLDLSYSMLETLDLGMTPNLERLDLKECHDLTELRVSNGCPERLVYLNLIGCSKFKKSFSFFKRLESCKLLSLPKLVWKLEPQGPQRYSRSNLPELRCTCFYLEEQASSIENSQKSVSLNLQPRTKLESFSGSICGLQHLRHLTLDGCIPEVPKDIDQLAYLEKLSLLSARIRCLPGTICMLKHLKSLELKSCELLEELPVELGSLERLEELSLLSTGIRRLPDSICSLKQLKSLTLKSCLHLAELPDNLGHLECLEKLNLLSARIKHLPDSICRLKQLKSLELESCRLLEKLPEGLGHLHCLEKLTLTRCASLVDIPISICDMKRLRCLHLPYCLKVEKLPEELGRLECLKELDVKFTGISHLPQSISSLIDLRVVGSEAVLQSCAFATQIQTSETETFCYIRAVENTSNGTELTNQVTENFSNRWTKMSRVYVGNLDPRVSKRELEDEFQVYGVLRNVWVARRPRGYAFVEFDDRRDALDAIRALDGKNGWLVKLFHNSKEVGGGGRGGARGRRGGGGDDLKCYECGEPGHFARECFLRVGPRGLGSGRRRSPSPRRRRSPSFGRRSYSPRYSPHGRRSTPRRSISPYRARSSRSPPPYRRARCDSRYANGYKF